MRQVVVEAFGAPDALVVRERPTPAPGVGEVLVAVGAAGVNYMDVRQRAGSYGATLPFAPGAEGSGTVAAVGEDAAPWRVGDRVVWTGIPGSYADHVVAPADTLIAVPQGLSLETAAAVLLQGLTARGLLEVTTPVRPGDSALVHSAAGGVGLLLVQMLVAAGVRVIGAVSTDGKAQVARDAGAHETIVYAGTDVAARVRERTGGEGAAAVYDAVGAATIAGSLAAARKGGKVVTYGAASGPAGPLAVGDLPPGVFAGRFALQQHYATRDARRAAAAALFDDVAAGRLRVTVSGRYALEQAPAAHAALESRQTTGKLLLVP